jgi:F-type H+-transporting ATPase subunit delta
MPATKAARRYATALLEIAKEQKKVEEILEDMELIQATIDGSRDLMLFLKSPIIRFDDKQGALEKIFGDRVQDLTNMFIKLLARKNRVNLLDQVADSFIQNYNEYAGIIDVEVYTAFPMSDEQQQDLLKALEQKTQKKVEMTINHDTSLMGGIAVRIEDTVIDGTVKHKLAELEQSFLNAAIE